MAEKNINSRIQQKHDIESNWLKAINFIPKQGELIIYDPDENYNYSRFKIGDGIQTINNLDFLLDTKYILYNSNTLSQTLDYMSSNKADSVKTASGEAVSLNNSVHTPLYGFKLYGKTTQDGTPTPETPVELVSTGEDGSVEVSVIGKNLFLHDAEGDYNLNVTRYSVANGTLIEILDNGGVIVQGNDSNNDGSGSYANGWYRPSSTGGQGITNASQAVVLNTGDIVTISADYTIIEYGYGDTASIGVYLYDYENYNNHLQTIKNVPVGVKNKLQATFTIAQTAHYYPVFTLNSAKVQIENIQIELGSAATDYEPYKTPETLTVSTPNDLAGIPVASGGNYTDNSGQQWICDEVDFARGVYVQRIGKSTVNLATIYPQSNSPSYASFVPVGKINAVNFGVMSPVAVQIPNNNSALRSNGRITENATNCVFWGEVGDGEAELRSKYDGTELYYVLATPIEAPLSAEQLQAYASLHTNEPNTTIINDGNAGMEVKYYTPSTAVQMVHSPTDEGKILSIDEHGCVVLSELDAGSIDINLDGANNGEINSINADTLGGIPANNYVLKDELEDLTPDGSNNSSVLLYTQQDLTEAQQAQVRENIGLDTYITTRIEEILLGGEW